MFLRFVPVALAAFALSFAAESQAATPALSAVPTSIEIAPPPAAYGTNTAALYLAVADEIRGLEPAKGPSRHVVVSVVLAPPTETAPTMTECSVNATLRDEKTGAVLSVIQSATRAEGPLTVAQRAQLAQTAVRRVVRKVPSALAESK